MTVGERIRMIRKKQGMTLQNFGEKLNLTAAAVSALELGKAKVTDRAIRDICQQFEIVETWLRTGEGPMQYEKPRDEILAADLEAVLTAGDDDFRKALIRWIIRMPPERWCIIEEAVLDLLHDVRNLAPLETPPQPVPLEGKNIHDWTPDEMAEEARRQGEADAEARKKGTGESDTYGRGNSGTA